MNDLGGGQTSTGCADELYFAGRKLIVTNRLGSDAKANLLPYGEEIGTPTGGDQTKFATYWRDWGGVDYADQRFYSASLGRFMTPDPYQASAGVADPSSWNRYAYVGGDPVNHLDPSGLLTCTSSDGRIECFDSVTVRYTFEPVPMYIAVHGRNGWDWQVSGRQYVGFQNLYEQPGCTDPITGLACWEADMLRASCGDDIPPPKPFAVDINANIKAVNDKIAELAAEGDPSQVFGGLIGWFTAMVQPGGEWDFKAKYGSQYENFGNWHFGVVGAAAFGSETFIRFGAGAAQALTDFTRWIHDKPRIGTGVPGLPPTYGDDRSDQDYIKHGFNFQISGCSRLVR